MANDLFNVGWGRCNEIVRRIKNNDPTNSALVVVLLKAVEADGTIQDYNDLSTLLAAAGNTEADFTNYARKTLTDADLTAPVPDDTNNWMGFTIPTIVWTSAGGATNNTLAKLLICVDWDTGSGTDSDIEPLMFWDYVITTDGTSISAVPDASGIFRAKKTT